VIISTNGSNIRSAVNRFMMGFPPFYVEFACVFPTRRAVKQPRRAIGHRVPHQAGGPDE
jgi:hypothetical protein